MKVGDIIEESLYLSAVFRNLYEIGFAHDIMTQVCRVSALMLRRIHDR